MTTRDIFLDALTIAPAQQNAPRRSIRPQSPPPPDAPVSTAITEPPQDVAPSIRPDYADDIDRIVCELVAAGDVVFDATLDAYRRPHCRRWRIEPQND